MGSCFLRKDAQLRHNERVATHTTLQSPAPVTRLASPSAFLAPHFLYPSYSPPRPEAQQCKQHPELRKDFRLLGRSPQKPARPTIRAVPCQHRQQRQARTILMRIARTTCRNTTMIHTSTRISILGTLKTATLQSKRFQCVPLVKLSQFSPAELTSIR